MRLWYWHLGWKYPIQTLQYPIDCLIWIPDLAKSTAWAAAYHCMKLCPWIWWCVMACSICLVGVRPWIQKLPIWASCLDPSPPGITITVPNRLPYLDARFGKKHCMSSCISLSEALPMDLMMFDVMFHLPCGCMAIDTQASYMSFMPWSIPSRLYSTQ